MDILNNELYNLCRTDFNFFFSHKNVNGVGYGYKEINGVSTGIPCFKVMVEAKLPKNQLSKSDLLPPEYKGFLTDVIDVGAIKPLTFNSKYRPAPGGVSIGVSNVFFAGTLGCSAFGNVGTTNNLYILSNNHVISNENSVLKETLILQPSQGEGGISPNDAIATLEKSIPLRFAINGNTPPNYVDCALGLVSNPSLISNNIITIGSPNDIAPPKLNLPIQKSGRTTEYTTDTIIALNASINVSYNTGTAFFVNQIIAGPMSASGDSGSAVLDMKNRVIGLLFAGSSSITAINDIANVLSFLGIRLTN